MSRSLKKGAPTWRRWGRAALDPCDEKAGCRRHPYIGKHDPIGVAVSKRRYHGGTEKILRRNRRIFERLAGKLRRSADRAEIAYQLHQAAPCAACVR